MPHFGSRIIDERGLELLRQWIAQLDVSAVADTTATDSRTRRVAEQLAESNRSTLQILLDEQTPSSPAAQSAIDRLLSSTSGSLLLASAIRRNSDAMPEEIRQEVIAKGASVADSLVRDLFEAFLPEDARTKTLGATVNTSSLLALTGNPDKGRSLFLTASGIQCRNCHKVGEHGKELGPDLTHIGKRYSAAEILENILDPSRKIDPKFQTWLVQTTDGKVQSGLLVSRSDQQVTLRDATGKDTVIDADGIDLMVAQKKSLMPELQLRDVTPQNAADLLAWLTSLK